MLEKIDLGKSPTSRFNNAVTMSAATLLGCMGRLRAALLITGERISGHIKSREAKCPSLLGSPSEVYCG